MISRGLSEDQAGERARREARVLAPREDAAGDLFFWQVSVDGRPAGVVVARLHDTSAGREAFILNLDGAVVSGAHGSALLEALEGALRDLGTSWVRLSVPARDAHVFENQDYDRVATETVRRIRGGEIYRHPEPLPTVEVLGMNQAQFDDYLAHAKAARVSETVRSGALPQEEAERAVVRDLENLLPDGLQTKSNLFLAAYDGQTLVGTTWLGLRKDEEGVHAIGHELRIHEAARGNGYAWAVMIAVSAFLRERDVVTVSARVYGYNEHVLRMLSAFGHKEHSVQFKKVLDGSKS
jgi:GNAT superfamily N-acetyltransferase